MVREMVSVQVNQLLLQMSQNRWISQMSLILYYNLTKYED